MRTDATRNRGRIIDAARALVAQHGAAVSMDAIATQAGVAVGTLYRHYPTKADLVAAVVDDSLEAMTRATQDAVDRAAAGADAGTELTTLFRELAARHAQDAAAKAAAAVLGRGASYDLTDQAPDTAAGQAVGSVSRLLEAAKQQGAVRADLTVVDLGLLLDGVPGADVPEAVRNRYVDIVLAGLRAADPPR